MEHSNPVPRKPVNPIKEQSATRSLQLTITQPNHDFSPPQNSYDRIHTAYFKATDSLQTRSIELFSFLEDARKNVLFLFGPSGCGKTVMVVNMLKGSQIPYEKKSEYLEEVNNEDEGRWVPIEEVITNTMQAGNYVTKVNIFFDFPTEGASSSRQIQFKKEFHHLLSRTQQKCIFILNSQIYNSFYLLNQNNPQQDLTKLPKVEVMKMSPYGKRDMKQILEFIQVREDGDRVDALKIDEIVELSHGDARKAINQLYWVKMQKYKDKDVLVYNGLSKPVWTAQKQKPKRSGTVDMIACSPFQKLLPKSQEVNQKFTIFHMLGKFLYGKRKNLNPKNKKQVSKYYTAKQLSELDPPFYFDPKAILQKSGLILPIFVDLLQENYINRFGAIRDIKDMATIFRMYDCFFGWTLRYDPGVSQLMEELVSWGILIYNRNSYLTVKNNKGGIQHFNRSNNTRVRNAIQVKKSQLKKFFNDHKLSDVLVYAHIKKGLSRLRNDLLLDLVFTRTTISRSLDEEDKTMKEEDDHEKDLMVGAKGVLDALAKEREKKERLVKMLEESADIESDIDSDS